MDYTATLLPGSSVWLEPDTSRRLIGYSSVIEVHLLVLLGAVCFRSKDLEAPANFTAAKVRELLYESHGAARVQRFRVAALQDRRARHPNIPASSSRTLRPLAME